MRVLITGASGLLGATLAEQLSARHDVTGCFYRNPISTDAFEAVTCDLTHPGADALIAELAGDVIVHCAAATNVDDCEKDPAYARLVNIEATRSVARAALVTGARVIAISTDAVFDGLSPLRTELDPTGPRNIYAKTKLGAEHIALSLGSQALVLRTNIYGWNAQVKTSLAEWVLARLRAGDTVPGFTDSFFTPLLANDLAGNIELLFAIEASGVLHAAGGERISKYEFARAVAREFGFDESLVYETTMADSALGATRSPDLSIDSSRARALGLATPSVAEGLARFHELEKSGYPALLRALIQ